MNVIERTKNNIKYAHYRRIRNKSFKKMKKHMNDRNSKDFKYWANKELEALRKCLEIQLH